MQGINVLKSGNLARGTFHIDPFVYLEKITIYNIEIWTLHVIFVNNVLFNMLFNIVINKYITNPALINGHVTSNALGSRYGSEQILGKETGNGGLEMHPWCVF
jgi:hypothetical protein